MVESISGLGQTFGDSELRWSRRGRGVVESRKETFPGRGSQQAEQFFVALRWHGVETQFVRFPEDNHDLTRGGKPRNRVEHCRRIADWFDTHS